MTIPQRNNTAEAGTKIASMSVITVEADDVVVIPMNAGD
jgi:hypothetical protein